MSKKTVRSAAVEAFERQIVREGAGLVGQWKPYLDSEFAPTIEGEYERYALARMLNTSNEMLPSMEAIQTTSVFGSAYREKLLGMTRQIFPRLWALQICSVQPLSVPTGMIFHLDITRDDGSTLGARADQDHSGIGYDEYVGSRTYSDHAGDENNPLGEAQDIQRSMRLSITSTPISGVKSKKLKTEASMELAQDLQAYHNLNPMELLQGAAVDQIAQEIDAEAVVRMRNAAIAHKTVTFGGTAPTGWDADKWRYRVQNAILRADTAIWRASLRRPNVMVCGVEAYNYLVDLNTFKMSPDFDAESGNYGLVPVGSLGTQYQVMLSRYIPDNEIILGRKGTGFLDAGLVYAPYIALFVSERFFDVEKQRSVQSFAHRSMFHTVSNTLFARIVIDEDASGIS